MCLELFSCRKLGVSITLAALLSTVALLGQTPIPFLRLFLFFRSCWWLSFCSSFKALVAEASAEETAAKEASDAKAEAEAEAEARRKEAAEKAKLQAANSSMGVRFFVPQPDKQESTPALTQCQFQFPRSNVPR